MSDWDLNISKDISFRVTAEATFINELVATFDDPMYIDPEYDVNYSRRYMFTKESINKMPDFAKNTLKSCRVSFNINDIESDEYGYRISGDNASIDIPDTMDNLGSRNNCTDEIDDDTYDKIKEYISNLKVSEIKLSLVRTDEIRSFFL